MNLNETVLITGTTGMLGKQFLSFFKDKYKNVYTLNRQDGDLLNFHFVKDYICKIDPDIIIHCIADTNLERCEKQEKQTLLLHCGLTHCLSSNDCKVVYISTCSVIQPHNFYDKTKLLGEQICLLNNKNSVIVRTNIYGSNSSSGNSLFEWAYNSFASNRQVTGYSDVFFNAIYTKQLVRSVYHLIKNNHVGVINIAGDYSISKFEFLQKICKIFNFNESLLIEGKQPTNFSVNRNKDITLNIDEAKQKYNIKLELEKGIVELKKDLEIQ
tara:strand:- start:2553 stop:3362 length:810 start_codon:yes stop_codon:yes gene_type:complete